MSPEPMLRPASFPASRATPTRAAMRSPVDDRSTTDTLLRSVADRLRYDLTRLEAKRWGLEAEFMESVAHLRSLECSGDVEGRSGMVALARYEHARLRGRLSGVEAQLEVLREAEGLTGGANGADPSSGPPPNGAAPVRPGVASTELSTRAIGGAFREQGCEARLDLLSGGNSRHEGNTSNTLGPATNHPVDCGGDEAQKDTEESGNWHSALLEVAEVNEPFREAATSPRQCGEGTESLAAGATADDGSLESSRSDEGGGSAAAESSRGAGRSGGMSKERDGSPVAASHLATGGGGSEGATSSVSRERRRAMASDADTLCSVVLFGPSSGERKKAKKNTGASNVKGSKERKTRTDSARDRIGQGRAARKAHSPQGARGETGDGHSNDDAVSVEIQNAKGSKSKMHKRAKVAKAAPKNGRKTLVRNLSQGKQRKNLALTKRGSRPQNKRARSGGVVEHIKGKADRSNGENRPNGRRSKRYDRSKLTSWPSVLASLTKDGGNASDRPSEEETPPVETLFSSDGIRTGRRRREDAAQNVANGCDGGGGGAEERRCESCIGCHTYNDCGYCEACMYIQGGKVGFVCVRRRCIRPLPPSSVNGVGEGGDAADATSSGSDENSCEFDRFAEAELGSEARSLNIEGDAIDCLSDSEEVQQKRRRKFNRINVNGSEASAFEG
uniref:CXXC-type domain-containing protein n=1 Tax=Odontella aurita TaxID=265563 RepID=A0A7S4NH97_9STRA|mmetsp:Transcript_6345/g.18596  ORF Transcript_6345/g.18596 Transcript_6345/m.18596 type:complete len:674 (+) Transcript_6345:394-2415(+)